MARKREATRARLLAAAFEVMAESGVDAAKIKDITDRADVGFGTFYNYFETKDHLASAVLDCIIDDLGRRNVFSTQGLRREDPVLVFPVSTRLVIREAAKTPIWQWWALRPDLLVDRLRDGFGPFAKRDMRDCVERGIFQIDEGEIDQAWALVCWIIVGGIHDIVVGTRPIESDGFVVQAVVALLGLDFAAARRVSNAVLPRYPAPAIDWTFSMAKAEPQ
jgi:AcrR family transcriptional regulator